ncbi:MAG: FAD-dependent oxidoreductase, partial [Armatimonadetes bacterium]|nr:FAD-dependent oxidoreductase [Armatimonadota bacterium]
MATIDAQLAAIKRRKFLKLATRLPILAGLAATVSPLLRFLKPNVEKFRIYAPTAQDAPRGEAIPVAMLSELAKPWDFKYFVFTQKYPQYTPEGFKAASVPGVAVRLPYKIRLPVGWAKGLGLEPKITESDIYVCSRICPQEKLCEGSCVLNAFSSPVAIGAIEKFINEQAFAHSAVSTAKAPPNGLGVAVIGSGPAGLACADQLAGLGYAVTVFEALPEAGGLLRYGIPGFKLESSVVRRRVAVLQRRGIHFRTGVMVGRDMPLGALQHEFDAIFLGFGAQKPKTAGIPGEDLKGVLQALPFLTGAPSSGEDWKGRRVVVLGGGDTAMDCLRSAIRLGAAESLCLYRRDEANMPGSRKDYRYAIEEGCRFEFLVNPLAIQGDAEGKVRSVTCVRMELGERDASGRRKPRAVPGTESCVPCDRVIVAYGFDPAPVPPLAGGPSIEVNEWGGIVVNEDGMTSVPGIFSGGDA